MPEPPIPESPWHLRYDLAWAHALLWVARTGRGGQPKSNVHVYMADRYLKLSKYHAALGARRKARRLESKAAWHYEQGGPEPPAAAAMAMPIPTRPLSVDAVAQERGDPDDVA